MTSYDRTDDGSYELDVNERTRLEGNSSPYLGATSPRLGANSPYMGASSPRPGASPSFNRNSLYAGDNYQSGRRGSPASYYSIQHARPTTPGTPGTFDSGLASFASGKHNRSSMGMYDAGASKEETSGGAGTGAALYTSRQRKGPMAWIKRRPICAGLIGLVILAVIAAAAVGGAVGATSGNNANKSDAASSTSSGTSGTDGKGSVGNAHGGTSDTPPASTSNTSTTITPLATWNQTDPSTKTVGVSLGGWLLMERWMNEAWFVENGGPDAWDEWSFVENLGPTKAKTVLTEHWNTWVNESDFDTLKSVGVNAVRIPVGYWAFMPAIDGSPYIAQAGQTDQITKVLGWLYDRGMYAMIDLHGMPGSQSGDQASGHNTSVVDWFNPSNIAYSYQVLNATLDFISTNKYKSVVQSVCPVNEPAIRSNSTRLQITTDYYENAYKYIKEAGLIMQFHHGFVPSPYSAWRSFVDGKDPNYISMNDNPYPGWFPPNSNEDNIVNTICSLASKASDFPVPVTMTEYSVVNNANSSSFNQEYYNTEVSAFSWSAGSFFWTLRTVHNDVNPVLAEADYVMDLYSFVTQVENGIISKVGSTTSALDTIKSLPNQQCGSIPTTKWSNPASG